MITFTATGLDSVQSSVSYNLVVKRQCLDANFIIKVGAIPSFKKYILEDPPLIYQLDQQSFYSDQTFKQCPHPVTYTVRNKDGTELSTPTF